MTRNKPKSVKERIREAAMECMSTQTKVDILEASGLIPETQAKQLKQSLEKAIKLITGASLLLGGITPDDDEA